MHAKSLQSCPTLCNATDCSPPGSSVHGILQARTLEWVAVPFSRGSSRLWNRTLVSCGSCLAHGFFTLSPQGSPKHSYWSLKHSIFKDRCPKCTDFKFSSPYWTRPWCWERLRAGGEGGDRGWDIWVASPTQWTWVWANSRRWWRTGKPGLLQFKSQRVRHGWVTEQQQGVVLLQAAYLDRKQKRARA